METRTLSQKCKTLMAQNGYFERGAKKALAKEIDVPYGSLIMALSGYREGKASINVLDKIVDHFQSAQQA